MSSQSVKLFTLGRSQAMRLPQAYRFDAEQVYVRRDPLTGDVTLSLHPDDWDRLFTEIDRANLRVTCLDGADANLDMTAENMFG